MFNSAAMCRQQEDHHRRIAAETSLANVKRIALAAASAWAIQAVEAESREAGSRDALSDADAAIALEFLMDEDDDAAMLPEEEVKIARPAPHKDRHA